MGDAQIYRCLCTKAELKIDVFHVGVWEHKKAIKCYKALQNHSRCV